MKRTPSLITLTIALLLVTGAAMTGCDEGDAPPAETIDDLNADVCATAGATPVAKQFCCEGLNPVVNSATMTIICVAPEKPVVEIVDEIVEPPAPPASSVVITPVADWNAESGLIAKIIGEKLGGTQFSLLTPVTAPLGSKGSAWYHHRPAVLVTGSEAAPTFSCTGLTPSKSQSSPIFEAFKPEGCKNQPGKCWEFNVTFGSVLYGQYGCKISVEGQEIKFQLKKQ